MVTELLTTYIVYQTVLQYTDLWKVDNYMRHGYLMLYSPGGGVFTQLLGTSLKVVCKAHTKMNIIYNRTSL